MIAETKKKIIHIVKMTGVHGTENHLLALLPLLNTGQYEIIFLMLVEPQLPMDTYRQQLEERGLTVCTMQIKKDVDPRCLWRIYSFLKQHKPDLIHTHLIHADVYGAVAAKLAGVKKIICTKHGYDEFRFNRFYALLDKLVSYASDRIITISDALARFLWETEGINKNKMVTIYYGLEPTRRESPDLTTAASIRREFTIPEGAPLIAEVGRLIPVKGHIFLLRAFKKILAAFPAVRLMLVGDGELRKDLEMTCKNLAIDRTVIFTGFRTDIDAIMESIDLLVHPALGEGFGLVCLEAMAQGKPIVASRVMSLPEIIDDGETGLLFAPGDEEALAGAVIELLQDQSKRKQMGEKGRERCEKLFSVERMVQATRTLYDEVLAL